MTAPAGGDASTPGGARNAPAVHEQLGPHGRVTRGTIMAETTRRTHASCSETLAMGAHLVIDHPVPGRELIIDGLRQRTHERPRPHGIAHRTGGR